MVWTAFLLGFLGSFHCLGMCGPIALAISASDAKQVLIRKLWYNLGRMLTYGTLGLMVGALGMGFQLAGWQQGISIGLGILIILFALWYKKGERALSKGGFYHFISKIKGALSFWLKQGGTKAFFMTGLINGLLPCGMVYIALLASMAFSNPWEGALYMLAFGAGTVPLLLALMLTGKLFTPAWRQKMFRMMPYLAVFIGVLFVVRGLGLGIHFISPELHVFDPVSGVPAEITICK
ncbi:sulfite exporter TauE/SafE family protein [Echinicola sediminis]